MEYLLSIEASKDLEDILDYFLNLNIDAGERFIKEFNKKCRNIAKFPQIGRKYGNIDPALRGVTLNEYIVFYQVFENSIIIVRVVSGYRDLESLFTDK